MTPLEGLPNFSTVVPNVLYRSGQPTLGGLAYAFDAFGVRQVVNLRWVADPEQAAYAQHMRRLYVHLRWLPVAVSLDEMHQWLYCVLDRRQGPTLVHCQEGVDRAGFAVAAYRIAVQEWPLDGAIREMRDVGYHRFPYFLLERTLRRTDWRQVREWVRRVQTCLGQIPGELRPRGD